MCATSDTVVPQPQPVARDERLGAAGVADRARRHGDRQRRAVLPGAQVVAVNTGTKDTYEATTNARATTTSSSSGPAPTRSRSRCRASRPSRRPASRSPPTRSCARTPRCSPAASTRRSTSKRRAQVLNTDSATVSETIGERAINELPLSGRNVWNLASTTPGVLSGLQQRHRPELPRRRPARDSEQPVARRHQLLVEPAGRDQHAPDRGCRDRGAGADRQHVGRIRLLSRRPHQRRDQERHERSARLRCRTSSRATRSTRAATSRTARNPKNPRKRNQFSYQVDGPRGASRGSTTAATRRSSWPPTKASASEAHSARSPRCRPR